jgi:hypothetical protein
MTISPTVSKVLTAASAAAGVYAASGSLPPHYAGLLGFFSWVIAKFSHGADKPAA